MPKRECTINPACWLYPVPGEITAQLHYLHSGMVPNSMLKLGAVFYGTSNLEDSKSTCHALGAMPKWILFGFVRWQVHSVHSQMENAFCGVAPDHHSNPAVLCPWFHEFFRPVPWRRRAAALCEGELITIRIL